MANCFKENAVLVSVCANCRHIVDNNLYVKSGVVVVSRKKSKVTAIVATSSQKVCVVHDMVAGVPVVHVDGQRPRYRIMAVKVRRGK